MTRLLRFLASRRKLCLPHLRAYQQVKCRRFLSLADQSQQGQSRRELRAHVKDEGTIYALSTASGRAAIAIIRCSGPECLTIYSALCPGTKLPNARQATLRALYSPPGALTGGDILDSNALVLYFPGPKTVTGEDVIEFHIHGGPAVVKAVLKGISECVPRIGSKPAVRYAEPGEFTRRAFYNDRLDLTQVEALGDTLSAETEQQRRLAVRGTTNKLNDRYEAWRYQLLQARGELEALIDFSEDQHFEESPAELTASVTEQVVGLQRQIHASIENASKGELLRGGINIALLGAPNAGKSSLLNRIVGREAAIVSREAGTTRDVVEVNVDIGGYFCKFGDLAGLRSNQSGSNGENNSGMRIGEVETEGIKRAKSRALAADVVVVVLDLQPDVTSPCGYSVVIDSEVSETLSRCDLHRQRVVFAVNKVDLLVHPDTEESLLLPYPRLPTALREAPVFFISCLESSPKPEGIQYLLNGLTEAFKSLTTPTSLDEDFSTTISWDESLGASERQRLLLKQAGESIDDYLASIDLRTERADEEGADIVVAAESLRTAAQSLSRITGRGEGGDVEEVLGVVFEKFCVGK